MTGVTEQALVFDCEGAQLPGVLHRPAQASRQGVLVVVGGPQTRVGSHRQFVLLARDLAAAGYPVLRFDYRGMGDADGEFVGFEGIAQDIRAAVDTLQSQCPDVSEVVIWGLCDAATAAAFYVPSDARITGLVLLNPWVRSEQGQAEAYLRHYYLRRLLQGDFWRKLLLGRVRVRRSAGSLLEHLDQARGAAVADAGTLAQRMLRGLSDFQGRMLLVLSGNDLTAQEFRQSADHDRHWRALLGRAAVCVVSMDSANHTFSRAEWRATVEQTTRTWLADE